MPEIAMPPVQKARVNGIEMAYYEAGPRGVFVETFRGTGFTGGVNWYRNFTRNWERPRVFPRGSTAFPA